jgi:hypothetical protein
MLVLGGAVAAVFAAGGCERRDAIRTYSAPKDPQPSQVSVASASPSSASGGGEVHFSAPPEWKAMGATGMSVATYRIADDPPLDLTVTPLPASAGEVLPNVNRWRGQLGLPQTSEAELSKDVTPVTVGGREAQLVDLTGPNPAADGKPQQRMLAAIVPLAGRVYFFKVSGAAERVGPQKAACEALVKSAHVDAAGDAAHAAPDHAGLPLEKSGGAGGGAGALPPGHPPVGPAATGQHPGGQNPAGQPAAAAGEKGTIEGIESYKLPDGWRVDPNPRPMRAASIIVGEGNQVADLAVSRLGANFGDKLANVNRWRGQAGLGPVKDAAEANGQEVAIAQGPVVMYDFAGPESAGAERKRLLVAMTQFPKAETVWFFRLLGPHDVVAKNKPAFDAFVRSLKFSEK